MRTWNSYTVRDGAGFARFDTVTVALDQGVLPARLSSSLFSARLHACTPADASPAAASERAPHHLCRHGPSMSRFLGIWRRLSRQPLLDKHPISVRLGVQWDRRAEEGTAKDAAATSKHPNVESKRVHLVVLVPGRAGRVEEPQQTQCLNGKPGMNRCSDRLAIDRFNNSNLTDP